MRSVFIYVLLISFIHSQAFGVSYITGDAIRSPDRSKTWLMPDTSDTLIGKETEDTLKNKTLEEPTIEDALVIKEVDAKPTPPSSGQKKIYCKDDGKCYTLDADDREKEVGSGAGGAGGINFLTDPNFEDPALTAWNPKSGLDYELNEDEALGPNVTAVCVNWDGSPNPVISQIVPIPADALGFSNVDGLNLGHKIWVKASFEGLKAEAMHLVGAGPATVANALDIPGDFKWREFDVTSVGTGSLTGVGLRIMPTNANTGKVCFARASVGPWDGIGSVAQGKACLMARRSDTNQTVNTVEQTVVIYNEVIGGQSCGTLNTTTGEFTVSEPGTYLISASVVVLGITESIAFFIRAGETSYVAQNQAPTSAAVVTGPPIQVALKPGDTVSALVRSTTDDDYTVQNNSATRLVITKIVSEAETVMRLGQGVDLMGAVLPYFTDKCPAGTFEVDGNAVPSIYQAFINRTGMSTLPNAAALVPRGIGSRTINGRTKTGPGVVGEIQEDQIQGHHHDIRTGGTSGSENRIGTMEAEGGSVLNANNSNAGVQGPITDGTNGTPRVGAETRVSSFGVRWCAAVASSQQPLVKQSVVYDDKVRAEGKSGVTSVDYGTWTPVSSNETNATITELTGRYIRIGDQVEVTVVLRIEPDAEGEIRFSLSKPIASDFSDLSDAAGTCVTVVDRGYIRVLGDTSSDLLWFVGYMYTGAQDAILFSCKINYVVK